MMIMPIDPNLNIVRNGLVLWYDPRMQTSYQGSGTTINDLSGNTLNGSLVNGPTFSSENGGSLFFDGTNDYISRASTTTLNLTGGNYTLCAWVKVDSNWDTVTNYSNIIGKGARARYETEGWSLFIFKNDPEVGRYRWGSAIRNGTSLRSIFSETVDINIPMYLVARVTNSEIMLYKNGILIVTGSKTVNPPTTTTNVYMCGGTSGYGFFKGNLYSAKIYNRTLTEEEIQHNFNQQRVRFGI